MNKYWGFGIKENRYYDDWVKIFESKEKNAQLLYSIVTDDSVDKEDFSIGCQAIVNFIYTHSLWVSRELFFKLIDGILDNYKNVSEWEGLNSEWVKNRKKVLGEYIDNFNTWPKVVNDDSTSIDSLNIIIEQQLALGKDIKNILNDLFVNLKGVAVDKYKVFPNVVIPNEFTKKLEDILVSLKELERKGVAVENIINIVVSLMGVKRWLI